MALRPVLVGLIVVATALFVLGVAIERGSGEAAHHEAVVGTADAAHDGSAGEEAASGESESGHAGAEAAGEKSELRPLGIDVEAWPFVALAGAVSLALALGVWLRPGAGWLLTLVAVAMLAFGLLDVREVFHQLDVDDTGLAFLAGVVAALHLAAALVAAAMASRTRQTRDAGVGPVPA
jgi:hypothetical protein